MGFTKLSQRISRSSIMTEPSDIFKVFIVILAECGPDGVVDVDAEYLSRVCYMPLKVVEKALQKLEGPDPRSRSKDCGGARIKKVDEGFFVVNYAKYRERVYSTSDAARRMRALRAKRAANVREHPRTVRTSRTGTERAASAPASFSGEKRAANVREHSASASASSSVLDSSSLRERKDLDSTGRGGAPVMSGRDDELLKKWGKDAILSAEQKGGRT